MKLELDFLPHLKKLEDLTKKPWLVSGMAGNYQSTFKGAGIEFEGFANYTPEQDSRRIDWANSSKTTDLVMRTYSEERDIQVYVLFDVSDNMFFSSEKKLKCEYAAELANSLLFSGIEAGDQVGLLMNSSKVAVNVQPKADTTQYFKTLNALTNQDNYGGARDMLTPIKTLLQQKKQRSAFCYL